MDRSASHNAAEPWASGTSLVASGKGVSPSALGRDSAAMDSRAPASSGTTTVAVRVDSAAAVMDSRALASPDTSVWVRNAATAMDSHAAAYADTTAVAVRVDNAAAAIHNHAEASPDTMV